jgi:hypothetical protein
MGTVIKFPRARRRRHDMPPTAVGTAGGVSASIIILPVVRIERILDAPSVKAKAAKSVAKAATKPTTARKYRKRIAPGQLPSQVYRRG